MKEQFTQNIGDRSDVSGENARFDVHSIHKSIPSGLPKDAIEAPGPQIGPGFLEGENSDPNLAEKNEKETNREKLEKIKEVILETDINLLDPRETYKMLTNELKSKNFFDYEFRTDVNYYFNQKLVYLYNKENLQNEKSETTEEARKKRKEAAFAGAKSMHDTIEKLEKIEKSGGSDDKIKEYWETKKTFFLGLMEKDSEHLHKKEKMLLENLQNAQKYGALAEKAARNLIKNSSVYIEEMINNDMTLKNFRDRGLVINVKDASIADDVYGSIDFYLEVILDGKAQYFPVQVKCGNIDVRYGEDEETQEFIVKNLVRIVGDEDRFRCSENSCYYEKKTIDKLNKFVEKALANNRYKKGIYVILPRGKKTLRENGDVDENIKQIFIEQFTKIILSLNFN